MNPLNLSPAAQAFWGSIIRHLLTAIAGILVTHGYVTQTGANAYIEELIGVAFYGAGQVWSSRAVILQRAKMLIALMLPKGSTENQIIAHLTSGSPVPSVLTPPNTAPGVPTV